MAFSALWTFLGTHGLEPSTPFKFALGLLQLGLGFVALWYGARVADARGMVGVEWLLLAYLLHTTGELCLSPVGLSMITKLSPAHLVSTVIGGWFLTTALAEFLGGMIAQFTRVGDSEGTAAVIPALRNGSHLRRRLRHHRHRRRRRRAGLLLPGSVAEAMDARGRGGFVVRFRLAD